MSENVSAGVGAIVLAAGSSSRMGTPKQLLQFRGQTLLRRAALAAIGAGCHPVIVVTGAHAERLREELRGLYVREAVNALWETGMASSIRAGMSALLESHAETTAVVLMLCDQPYLNAEVIAALINSYRTTRSRIVASQYNDSFGVPALFSRPLFGELAGLEGEGGAKHLIKRYASEAQFVPFHAGEIDLDTPDDFSRLLSKHAGQ